MLQALWYEARVDVEEVGFLQIVACGIHQLIIKSRELPCQRLHDITQGSFRLDLNGCLLGSTQSPRKTEKLDCEFHWCVTTPQSAARIRELHGHFTTGSPASTNYERTAPSVRGPRGLTEEREAIQQLAIGRPACCEAKLAQRRPRARTPQAATAPRLYRKLCDLQRSWLSSNGFASPGACVGTYEPATVICGKRIALGPR